MSRTVWLGPVSSGVYRRPTANLTPPADHESPRWQYVVISLQALLSCPVHVGGRTALELEGFAHYLQPSGPREIHLYGAKAHCQLLTFPVDRAPG